MLQPVVPITSLNSLVGMILSEGRVDRRSARENKIKNSALVITYVKVSFGLSHDSVINKQ